jgi:hypothetical protein
MEQKFTFENDTWFYFGYGVGWDSDRCDKCYELIEKLKRPNKYCINCWKLEIFFSNCTDIKEVKKYFLKEAERDRTLHGKWLKKTARIPRQLLTSIPASAHPDKEIERDGVILIFTQSISEREKRRKKILSDLKARNLYKKRAISYRRGCVNFDEIIGPWKRWHDLNKDFEEWNPTDLTRDLEAPGVLRCLPMHTSNQHSNVN